MHWCYFYCGIIKQAKIIPIYNFGWNFLVSLWFAVVSIFLPFPFGTIMFSGKVFYWNLGVFILAFLGLTSSGCPIMPDPYYTKVIYSFDLLVNFSFSVGFVYCIVYPLKYLFFITRDLKWFDLLWIYVSSKFISNS